MFKPPSSPLIPLIALAVATTLAAAPAWAERADREREITATSERPCVLDYVKKTQVCSGNVIITQGTLVLKADQVELRELADGYRVAVATGSAAKPATYREKRDGSDEYIDATAQRIEYEERSSSVRFINQAVARMLRGNVPTNVVRGSSIVWDGLAQQLNVQPEAATSAIPTGRARMVMAPTPSRTASGATPAATATSAPPLRISPALGDRR